MTNIRVLHIKGSALAEALRWAGRRSTDADVLVDPDRVDRFVDVCLAAGFVAVDSFDTGSPFGHSMTLHHPLWGFVDVHRFVPGLGPTPHAAFETLWAEHGWMMIAGLQCPVPEPHAQRLVQLLHAARAPLNDRSEQDVLKSWHEASDDDRAAVDALAARFGADLPVALATGRDTDRFAGQSDYDLWLAVAKGATRAQEWRARIKAQSGLIPKARTAVRALVPNADSIAARNRRRPTSRELIVEAFARLGRGLREEIARRRQGGAG